jgi:hypothetical protein
MYFIRYQTKSAVYEDLSKQISFEKFQQEGTVSTLLRKTNKELTLMVQNLAEQVVSEKCKTRELQLSQKVPLIFPCKAKTVVG